MSRLDALGIAVKVPSPLVELRDERLERHGVRVWLKRDDLIHPDMPGNKWRKLKFNLAAAREQGYSRLLTFGGAFSNHSERSPRPGTTSASTPSASSGARSACHSTSLWPPP